jgi:hypothetical protein
MKMYAKLICALTLALPISAGAEPLPKPVAEMDCLVGAWKGGGSVSMGKDTAKIDASWTCKRTSAQFGVLCTFHVTGIPGVSSYDETDLMGYEPNSNTYHWYSVTNAGETHDHVAKVSGGNTIQFVFVGTQQSKPLKEVIDLSFGKDKKSLTGRAETFLAGESTSVMDLKMRK